MGKVPIRIAQVVGKMENGGVESVVMNYYRHIDKEKVQFDFIVDMDSSIPQRQEIEELGGRIILVPPYQHLFSYLKTLNRIFKNNHYRIVHSHLNTLSVFPLFAAWNAKIPIRIAHAHSAANWKEWKKTLLKYILKPFSKLFATDYFACSQMAGEFQFGKRTFRKEQVTILYNAIEIEKFQFDLVARQQIRSELSIAEDTMVVGHVGRFTKQKNHEFLISIFIHILKQNSNSILLLIGEGELESKIKEKVQSLGIDSKVQFLGAKKEIEKYYQAMDVFLLPSLYEGLGMVLVEAQIAGLFCVASNKVPKEAQVSNHVSFLALGNSIKWSEHILKERIFTRNRENSLDLTNKNHYDIDQQAKLLENNYKNMWEREDQDERKIKKNKTE